MISTPFSRYWLRKKEKAQITYKEGNKDKSRNEIEGKCVIEQNNKSQSWFSEMVNKSLADFYREKSTKYGIINEKVDISVDVLYFKS